MARDTIVVDGTEFKRGLATGDQVAVTDDTFAQLLMLQKLVEKLGNIR